MLGELTESQINNLLSSQVVGRIACVAGRRPYIVPVLYIFDGENIYGQSREGMKLDRLRKNPAVCFEVDSMTDVANWQSVVVYGKFEELFDDEADYERRNLLDRVMPIMTASRVHSHEHGVTSEIDDENRIKKVMYRIKIKEKTGRYEKR
jgi:nitroimidazol reductase NimA-like FMN-containing flavoprotein (pyridoxamine 5'-phosphate oxidase superfamily)